MVYFIKSIAVHSSGYNEQRPKSAAFSANPVNR
jgi:hypothetical protein